MQPTKYQCTQRANLKNPHTYIYIYIHACEERETIKKITQINT